MAKKITFHLSEEALNHFKGTLPEGTTSFSFDENKIEEKPWGWLGHYEFEGKENAIALSPEHIIRIVSEA